MTVADVGSPASAAMIFAPDPRSVEKTRPSPSATSTSDAMKESSATIVSSPDLSAGNANRLFQFHVHLLFDTILLVKR
jgi:hypothetical protein